jgi:nodulation protein E
MQVSTKLVGQVIDFDPKLHFEPQQIGLLDRVSQFAVIAARQAVAQSGLVLDDRLAEHTAAIIRSC